MEGSREVPEFFRSKKASRIFSRAKGIDEVACRKLPHEFCHQDVVLALRDVF